MEVSDDLQCVFTARLENNLGTNQLDVPQQEVDLGNLEVGETYRVAIYPAETSDRPTEGQRQADAPVSKGEKVRLEIEDIGEQGDGLGRIGPGYIVFVPDTDIGDEVMVEIQEVTENFAFGETVESV